MIHSEPSNSKQQPVPSKLGTTRLSLLTTVDKKAPIPKTKAQCNRGQEATKVKMLKYIEYKESHYNILESHRISPLGDCCRLIQSSSRFLRNYAY